MNNFRYCGTRCLFYYTFWKNEEYAEPQWIKSIVMLKDDVRTLKTNTRAENATSISLQMLQATESKWDKHIKISREEVHKNLDSLYYRKSFNIKTTFTVEMIASNKSNGSWSHETKPHWYSGLPSSLASKPRLHSPNCSFATTLQTDCWCQTCTTSDASCALPLTWLVVLSTPHLPTHSATISVSERNTHQIWR